MKRSSKFLLAIYLSFIINGIAEGLSPATADSYLAFAVAHGLLISVLLFAWCGSHANENKIAPPSGSKMLTALISPIGVPYYFIAGYGLRNGSIMVAKSVGFFALCNFSYLGLFYVLQYA